MLNIYVNFVLREVISLFFSRFRRLFYWLSVRNGEKGILQEGKGNIDIPTRGKNFVENRERERRRMRKKLFA